MVLYVSLWNKGIRVGSVMDLVLYVLKYLNFRAFWVLILCFLRLFAIILFFVNLVFPYEKNKKGVREGGILDQG